MDVYCRTLLTVGRDSDNRLKTSDTDSFASDNGQSVAVNKHLGMLLMRNFRDRHIQLPSGIPGFKEYDCVCVWRGVHRT